MIFVGFKRYVGGTVYFPVHTIKKIEEDRTGTVSVNNIAIAEDIHQVFRDIDMASKKGATMRNEEAKEVISPLLKILEEDKKEE